MSVTTNRTIFCDGNRPSMEPPSVYASQSEAPGKQCHHWADAGVNMSASQVRAALRPQGWVRRRANERLVDLCPWCAAAEEEKPS